MVWPQTAVLERVLLHVHQGVQLIDQAATGRFFEGQNGERANTGLFNVLDRPYKDMLGQMLEAHLDIYPVWFGRQDAWKSSGSR